MAVAGQLRKIVAPTSASGTYDQSNLPGLVFNNAGTNAGKWTKQDGSLATQQEIDAANAPRHTTSSSSSTSQSFQDPRALDIQERQNEANIAEAQRRLDIAERGQNFTEAKYWQDRIDTLGTAKANMDWEREKFAAGQTERAAAAGSTRADALDDRAFRAGESAADRAARSAEFAMTHGLNERQFQVSQVKAAADIEAQREATKQRSLDQLSGNISNVDPNAYQAYLLGHSALGRERGGSALSDLAMLPAARALGSLSTADQRAQDQLAALQAAALDRSGGGVSAGAPAGAPAAGAARSGSIDEWARANGYTINDGNRAGLERMRAYMGTPYQDSGRGLGTAQTINGNGDLYDYAPGKTAPQLMKGGLNSMGQAAPGAAGAWNRVTGGQSLPQSVPGSYSPQSSTRQNAGNYTWDPNYKAPVGAPVGVFQNADPYQKTYFATGTEGYGFQAAPKGNFSVGELEREQMRIIDPPGANNARMRVVPGALGRSLNGRMTGTPADDMFAAGTPMGYTDRYGQEQVQQAPETPDPNIYGQAVVQDSDRQYLDQIKSLRDRTKVPNARPFDSKFFYEDPALRSAYFAARQSKYGIPVESQLAMAQQYRLQGASRGSLGAHY